MKQPHLVASSFGDKVLPVAQIVSIDKGRLVALVVGQAKDTDVRHACMPLQMSVGKNVGRVAPSTTPAYVKMPSTTPAYVKMPSTTPAYVKIMPCRFERGTLAVRLRPSPYLQLLEQAVQGRPV
jgi:hypothetical protein